jgi:hypothetical protein
VEDSVVKGQEEDENNSVQSPQTIHPEEENNSEDELFEPDRPPSQADTGTSETYKKKGKGGRVRSYEKVRKVILYRKKLGRYDPDLSEDMQRYYDFWYFTKPNRRRDKENYDRHVKAYSRGQKWLTEAGF